MNEYELFEQVLFENLPMDLQENDASELYLLLTSPLTSSGESSSSWGSDEHEHVCNKGKRSLYNQRHKQTEKKRREEMNYLIEQLKDRLPCKVGVMYYVQY